MNYMYVFLFAIIAGGLYSVIWWLGSMLDPKKITTSFSLKDFLLTTAVGALIGLIVIYGQLGVMTLSPELQVFVYASMTAGVRKGLLTFFDRYLS